jgi:hypothetical protein
MYAALSLYACVSSKLAHAIYIIAHAIYKVAASVRLGGAQLLSVCVCAREGEGFRTRSAVALRPSKLVSCGAAGKDRILKEEKEILAALRVQQTVIEY